ncbi:hypothetical protein, partial [Roseibium sp.]
MTQSHQKHRRFADIAGAADTRSRRATGLLLVAALVMLGIHVMQLATFALPSGQFRNFHLGFAIVIGFLALIEQSGAEQRLRRIAFWALTALTVALMAYIHVEYEALTQVRSFLPSGP